MVVYKVSFHTRIRRDTYALKVNKQTQTFFKLITLEFNPDNLTNSVYGCGSAALARLEKPVVCPNFSEIFNCRLNEFEIIDFKNMCKKNLKSNAILVQSVACSERTCPAAVRSTPCSVYQVTANVILMGLYHEIFRGPTNGVSF